MVGQAWECSMCARMCTGGEGMRGVCVSRGGRCKKGMGRVMELRLKKGSLSEWVGMKEEGEEM